MTYSALTSQDEVSSLLSSLKKPKAILFDWDNTLVDTFDLIHSSANHVLNHFNLPSWTLEEAKSKIQGSARDSLPTLFGDKWQEALEIYRDFYHTHHLTALKGLEGASSLLQTLHQQKIPMGIVSNKSGSLVRKEVTHLSWDPYFLAIIGSGDAARDKPSPDVALMALKEMKVDPCAEVWFVGDAPVDWACAKAVGCYPIPVGNHHVECAEYPHVAADCVQLEMWVKELHS